MKRRMAAVLAVSLSVCMAVPSNAIAFAAADDTVVGNDISDEAEAEADENTADDVSESTEEPETESNEAAQKDTEDSETEDSGEEEALEDDADSQEKEASDDSTDSEKEEESEDEDSLDEDLEDDSVSDSEEKSDKNDSDEADSAVDSDSIADETDSEDLEDEDSDTDVTDSEDNTDLDTDVTDSENEAVPAEAGQTTPDEEIEADLTEMVPVTLMKASAAAVSAEEVTYRITLHTDSSENEKVYSKTTSNSTLSYTLPKLVFQIPGYKDRLNVDDGYKMIGWSTEEDSDEVEYNFGEKITLSSDDQTELDLYPVYAEMDKVNVKVTMLYQEEDGSYRLEEEESEEIEIPCLNYAIDHPESGSMHQVYTVSIYEAASEVLNAEYGYEITGLGRGSAADPVIDSLDDDSTMNLSDGSQFYLIAEKSAPAEVTYSVQYHQYGTDEVEERNTKTSEDDFYTVYLPSRVFQIPGYTNSVSDGLKLIGWAAEEGATEVTYSFGQRVTLTKDAPVLELYPVFEDMDQASLRVAVLYQDDSLENGYKLGEEETISLTCLNYAIDHPESGTMHQVYTTSIYDAAKAALSVEDDYEVTGLGRGSAANPVIDSLDEDSVMNFSDGSLFYLIAEKSVPAEVTYSVRFHQYSTDEVEERNTKTSEDDSYTVYLPSRVFQIPGYTNSVSDGLKLIGWAAEEGATEVIYSFGQKVTLTKDAPVLELYPVFEDMDQASLRVAVLYQDDSLENGYKLGEEETISLTCLNYAIDHPESGSMHQVYTTSIYDAAKAALSVEDDYEVTGLGRGNAANPVIDNLAEGTIMNFSDGSLFYLIAEKSAPAEVTYSVRFHQYGTDEVEERNTKTSEDDSYIVYLPSRVFQIPGYTNSVSDGLKLIGWAAEEGATEVTYSFGQKVTLTKDAPVLELYPVFEDMDQASLRVAVLYQDDSLENGYKLGEEETISLTCLNYAIDHPESGTMHQVYTTSIYDAAKAALSVEGGYEVTGLGRGTAANPVIDNLTEGTIMNFSDGSLFYLIAEKSAPAEVTYSVRFHQYGTDEVEERNTKTSEDDTYTVYLPSRVFQIPGYTNSVSDGLKLIGWAAEENATEAIYSFGQKVTLTKDAPVLELYPVFEDMDQASLRVAVLYQDDSLENGYKLGEEETISLTCLNYAIDHPESGTMHQVYTTSIYDAAKAALSVEDDYEVTGLGRGNAANPVIDNLAEGTIMNFSDGSLFYLIAEKSVAETKDITVVFKDADGNVIGEPVIINVPADAQDVDLQDVIPDGYEAANSVAVINEDGTAELIVAKTETPDPVKEYKEVSITIKDNYGNIIKEVVINVEKDAEEADLTDQIPDGYEAANPVVVFDQNGNAELIVAKTEAPTPEDKFADAVLTITYVNSAGTAIGTQTITKNGKVGESAVFVSSDMSAPSGYRLSTASETITVAYGTTSSANVTVSRKSSGGSGSSGSGSSSGASSHSLVGGEWRLDEVGWWYPYSNGTYAKGGWYQLIWKGVHEWYYFNETGYLISGWYTDVDGNKYYLHPLHDGDFGRMYTGWNLVDGKWEFFNDNPEAGKLGSWVEGKEVPAELQ